MSQQQLRQNMKTKKLTTLPIRKSIGRSPLRRGLLLIALACFGLSPAVRAVSPPPDGGYPGSNTAEGDSALFSLTSGSSNTANGFQALFSNTIGNNNMANGYNALFSNTTGVNNTANGFDSLNSNTIGNFNTATGGGALFSNTTGNFNTANGVNALQNNNADNNTANGANALFANTSGIANTATGDDALFSNTTGTNNTANGAFVLYNNTTGNNNMANGYLALVGNTTGSDNTANGTSALQKNTTGDFNTANGVNAIQNNTTGSFNTATGLGALKSNTTASNNTANGVAALLRNTTGSSNIALGISAGSNLTTGSNNIDIGNVGVAGEAAKIRIGTGGTQTSTFIAGISGVTVTGTAVVVNSSGQLGVAPSSARFKDEIKPMDKASEAILALKPVTFRYKHELDPDGIPQFGLVAEQVEKVNPDLVVRDAEGKVFTVRYEAVNAMLLNEFLKAHRKMEEQETTITQLKKSMEVLTASVKQQASQIQKVSAQLEVSKTTRQIVVNDQ
jgi:trimeric autotransporter adhesin